MATSTSSKVSGPVQSSSGGLRGGEFKFCHSQLGFEPINCNPLQCNGFCSTKTDGKKKDDAEKATTKKRLKLLKGLSFDLSKYSKLGISLDGSVDDRRTIFLGLSQILIDELHQQKAKKKEIKRKRKEDKMKLKVKSKKKRSHSSSSSSESSDSECDEVVRKNRLRSSAHAQPTKVEDPPQDTAQADSSVNCPNTCLCEYMDKMSLETSSAIAEATKLQDQVREQNVVEEEHNHHIHVQSKQDCSCTISTSSAESSSYQQRGAVDESIFSGRIDVCTGAKCRKLGAEELLRELEGKIGVESVVVGCKCMGKCRSAPNVQVPNNPLYIGVGLEDLDSIVASFLGGASKNVGSMTAA